MKATKRKVRSQRRGSALALVLLVVVILLVTGTGLLSLSLQSQTLAIRTSAEIQARSAADAGLTKAIFEVNEKLKVKPWDGSTLPLAADETLPNCNAVFSYTITGDIDSGYTIESIGNSGHAEKRVYAAIELQGPFEYALSTQGTIILKSDTLIDGYNSLDPGDTDVEVKIATNSILPDSIILNNGVTVDGDVLVGVDGDADTVIKDMGGTTGDRYAMFEEIEFPAVTPPVLPDMGGDIYVKGNILNITPASSGKYTAINVLLAGSKQEPLPATLIVSCGDVVLHVTGDILVGQLCEIQVKNNASLTLYVDGDIHCHANGGIGNENVPEKLKLYATGQGEQSFDLKAKSDWYGVVYAPNADVAIFAYGDVYGSIVANDFEFKYGGNFYYDEALRNVSVDTEAVRFVVKRWHE